MAKKSAIENNLRKQRLAKKFSARRARLLGTANDEKLSMEERFEARLNLAELPRNGAKVRIRNRCEVTGRPRAYYRKMRAKLGAPKAITATAHKIARILYIMIREKKSFIEIGQAAYEKAHKEKQIASLKKKAKELGFTLAEMAAC